MNSVVKQMFIVLIVVGSLSGMVLAGSYSLTKPMIEKHKLEELQQAIFVVLPEAKTYEEISSAELKAYKGFTENNEPAGYAFVAAGTGFQGIIKMIVGMAPDMHTMLGMQVLEQVETPGLGAKITEDGFEQQFSSLTPNWADTVSAATAEAQSTSTEEASIPSATAAVPVEQTIPEYINYVKNLTPDDPNEIQAITGATISSVAVVNIINEHLYTLWDVVGDNQ